MKKLTMWLGCALTALAIGCGDGSAPAKPGVDPKVGMPDPAEMEKMMKKHAETSKPAGEDSEKAGDTAKANGETEKPATDEKKDDATEKPAADEKKDGETGKPADTEKKDGKAEEK